MLHCCKLFIPNEFDSVKHNSQPVEPSLWTKWRIPQERHSCAPLWLMYFPRGHGKHSCRSLPSCGWYRPTLHLWHWFSTLFMSWRSKSLQYFFASSASISSAVPDRVLPAGHKIHWDDPISSEYFPGLHLLHSDLPSNCCALPGALPMVVYLFARTHTYPWNKMHSALTRCPSCHLVS